MLFVLGGCATGGPAAPDGNHKPAPDGSPSPDGSVAIDAPVGPHPDAPTGGSGAHLLLSEITLAPAGSEFIEIANPTTQSVSLAHYYLSDNGNYWKLPAGVPTLTAGDFIVQFPAGATLAPGAVITVAIGTAAAFSTAFGVAPTYSVTDGTVTKTAVSGTPSLTDSGEMVVLFSWDGTAPLVKDVDLMIAGIPTAGNSIVIKSGVTQNGATYAADTDSIAAQASTPGSGQSTKRIALETGHESQGGSGNGITGDDETSEATSATWDGTGFTAPTPGQIAF